MKLTDEELKQCLDNADKILTARNKRRIQVERCVARALRVSLVALALSALAMSLAVYRHVYAGELYLELGVGHDHRIDEGRNPQSVIRLRYEMSTPKWWTPDVLEYNHHSSIHNGPPFNDRPEDTADQASVVWRFRLK